VNLVGAGALGWIVASDRHRALLGSGVCGALTTFSAFQLELLQMLDAERVGLAAAYAAVSLAAGLAAVALGRRLA